MRAGSFTMSVLLCTGLAASANAGEVLRIGHTMMSANTNAAGANVDSGLYAASIDASNGFAYFTGSYVSKVNLASNLPVQIGPGLQANHALQSAIDPAAGYLYLPRGTVLRFALGAGTNVMSSASPLTPSFGSAAEMLIDDSDPNPTNHYGYLLCTSAAVPARVSKVALSTFTELNSIPLAANESNFLFYAQADVPKGYGYFVTTGGTSNTAPMVVKIKFTPGTNAPVRVGAANLDATNAFVGGSAIDTLHGYAYYGGNISDTNIPGIVCKMKLGEGDVAPSSVGKINLRAGEGRLASSVCDPANGFGYFADDNTYPGRLYQLAMNGTNLPVEIGYTEMLGTTNAHPSNGNTAANTNGSDGNLLYGEVFFRSAVFDPVRGFAYLGQDSRPNQAVKVQVAQINPFTLTGVNKLNDGSCQFGFTNIMGAPFSVLSATNLSLSPTNWTTLGAITDSPPGQYQSTDPSATTGAQLFYRVSSP